MSPNKLELRQERDFGEKFNAVFTFVQTNFKSFLKVILFTAGPLILIGGIFFGLFISKMFGMIGTGLEELAEEGGILGMAETLLAYFFLGLASLWLMIAVYAFMAEYDRGNGNITAEAVWNRGKGKILPVIGFGMLMGIAAGLFVFVIFLLPGNDTGGWMALKILLYIVAIFYVFITISLVVPNMVIEDAGLFESIGRSFILIRGKWWSTFGLLFIMGLVANIATSIFLIPFYIVSFASLLLHLGGVGDILTIAGSCILFLGVYVMATLPALAIGFQYFNLVERKEGTGLLKKIDQLGQSADTANEGDY